VQASAKRIPRAQVAATSIGRRKTTSGLPWQERALFYYDQIGELHFAAQFYARALSRLRLYVAYRNPDDGALDPVESGPAVDLLERVQDPGGGRTVMLSTYGQLMFVTGECYLVNLLDEDEGEKWEVLSTDELKYDETSGVYRRRVAPGSEQIEYRAAEDDDFEPLDDEVIVYRCWKRHPRYSAWADSPMRANLDIAEELMMLTLAVRARARSRLAQSGILYLPEELSPKPLGVIGDEDPEADPWVQELTTHFITPIEDEGTAAAVVPFVIRGPAQIAGVPAKDAIFHLQTHSAEESYPEAGLRTEAIKRLALGLDMPPEALLGMTDANHWTAWQVQDAIWQSHLAPVSQQLCDDLTSVYLRPSAIEQGLERAEDLVVAYDASELLTDPDRGKDANDLYDRRAIGKKALRDAKGFDDEDAPDEDELEEMLAVALRDASLIAGLPAEGEAPVEEAPGPPVDEEEGDEEEMPLAASGMSARVLGAAELALHRCRELAGSRLRSKYRARQEMKVTDGYPNGQVASLLGPVVLDQLGADANDLVSEGAGAFRTLLVSWGHADREAEALASMLELYAARTLFDRQAPPAPAGFAGYLQRNGRK
jgi:predicted DNA-binding protein